MRVLIACEFSGVVREEFRKKGHDAWSCDLIESEDGSPYHIKGDAICAIYTQEWDLIIAHPPCTRLSLAGNKWYKPQYSERFPYIHKEREYAVDFFMKIANAPCKKIAIENPVGIMSSKYRKPDQIIQPWQFGHEASKKTCLWLKGLPKLIATEIVGKGDFIEFKSGKRMSKWYCYLVRLNKEERQKERSRTFIGIAKAMAEQWG